MGPVVIDNEEILHFLKEDGVASNAYYELALPKKEVFCKLYFKSPLTLAGLPWFFKVFEVLGEKEALEEKYSSWEGQNIDPQKKPFLEFKLPAGMALSGERIALNLLQRASSIASYTSLFVAKAEKYQAVILDTRKTLPGYRSLDKYAVRMGGGQNHRFSQTDIFMIKDNHKNILGGLKEAVDFFRSVGSFYTPIIAEIHNLSELTQALDLGVSHLLLDRFSLQDLKKACELKRVGVTYEISGNINLDNIENYLEIGLGKIDAVSVGSLTYGAPAVDISLKMELQGKHDTNK
ncbi:MAG: carboxylating nicotinate-nucleotide diphosphorylase [Bacteriovoracaceae bacterium]|nr:carboxylating nicotinate-nucleotide diphosphorylase [Bacteriovoracaceae bacterium]